MFPYKCEYQECEIFFFFDTLQNPSVARICWYVIYLYFWIRCRIKIQHSLKAVGISGIWLSLILSISLCLGSPMIWGMLLEPSHWEQRPRKTVRCRCLSAQYLGLWEGVCKLNMFKIEDHLLRATIKSFRHPRTGKFLKTMSLFSKKSHPIEKQPAWILLWTRSDMNPSLSPYLTLWNSVKDSNSNPSVSTPLHVSGLFPPLESE